VHLLVSLGWGLENNHFKEDEETAAAVYFNSISLNPYYHKGVDV